ncbi:hypothetical protein, variant 2 [Aphanomyces invadans]|uniref:Uncharacterized protein n=1 Tax=Aphanomyces invadans TaxID=157072 RepID=A0A024TFY4_9STRA|nr:hypothetical protein, variant 2 [Aphanomyces invadans]ETV93080.1 hypothetical protein, variant 2 [Aphanomyces invadans]|eukprot:XP_008878344.1 hypothetical protein, variant 2 [Aphanomyces invadans]
MHEAVLVLPQAADGVGRREHEQASPSRHVEQGHEPPVHAAAHCRVLAVPHWFYHRPRRKSPHSIVFIRRFAARIPTQSHVRRRYKLPHCDPAPLIHPKFLRDSFQTADIEGTRAAPRYTHPPRDCMNLSDIAGATASWRPRGVKTSKQKDSMQVADIIHAGFQSQRVTDALRPVHVVNGFRSADDPRSFPKAPYKSTNHPFYPLETHDIQGANPTDSLKGVVGNIPHVKRRHFRSTNNVQDIRGAQANTVHHSIVSNRQVRQFAASCLDDRRKRALMRWEDG